MSWGTFDNSMQNEGGFMDTTATEGAGDEKGPKRGQNCIPVMIGHLNRFSDKLAVWGIPAKIVTFLAVVRKLEFTSTKVSFEFQDETGLYLCFSPQPNTACQFDAHEFHC